MKRYKVGDECTFTEDQEEYQNIKEFCQLLNDMSPNKHTYIVKNIYLDFGQDWLWTTISDITVGCQVLSPRDWLEIVNRDRSYKDIIKDFFEDKYCQDKPKKE